MNFLTPWFLLGGLALGVPLVLHLRQRTTREQTLFSSLRFLAPAPPRLTQRSRLEDLLLLLLRCLALALLVIGFARPFLPRAGTPPPLGTSQRILILLDTSASMRRSGLEAEAVRMATSTLNSARPTDEIAIYSFDRNLRTVLSFDEWQSAPVDRRREIARTRLSELQPSWAGTQLGTALVQAAEILAEPDGEQKHSSRQRLILISDQQEGSHCDPLASYEWPPGIEFAAFSPRTAGDNNAGLSLAPIFSQADSKEGDDIRVLVSNVSGSKREKFQVGWVSTPSAAFEGKPMDVAVPAGQTRIVTLPARPRPGLQQVHLQGDDDEFDNTVFIAPPAVSRKTVLYWGEESADDIHQPLFFLRRALSRSGPSEVELMAHKPSQEISNAEIESAALLVVTDGLPEALASRLRSRVENGASLLLAPKSVEELNRLSTLFGGLKRQAENALPDRFALLSEIDFRHPLFAPFSDPGFRDFSKIHFWKYRRLNLSGMDGLRVAARFDNGDPAVVEVPLLKGRIILFLSGWAPSDSQLALSSKFVPLMEGILAPEQALLPPETRLVVGDPIPLPSSSKDRQLERPGGQIVNILPGVGQYTDTREPGIYRLVEGASSRSWAVNVDPVESRTAPLPLETWIRLSVPLAAATNGPVSPGQPYRAGAEVEAVQKLWRWFVLATLLILGIESVVAGLRNRNPVALQTSLA